MIKMYNLEKIAIDSFDWLRWRNFDLYFCEKIICRDYDIILHKNILREYAIGYCEAEHLICRPKKNCFAVMFLKDDIFSWCHLTEHEFFTIFGKEGK